MRWVVVLAGCAAAPETAAPDAAAPTWAAYTIAAGAHDATLAGREPKNPMDGVVGIAGRDFDFAFDASAIYELTMPTQPEDQLDWNKLPGLSDCGGIDLSVDGAMFGWRWNLDQQVLEVAAYANNAGTHLDQPLFTLTADELAQPLHYRVWREPTVYEFSANGHTTTLPRRCSEQPVDPLAWAGAFYFGGTSVAPHPITARIREQPF